MIVLRHYTRLGFTFIIFIIYYICTGKYTLTHIFNLSQKYNLIYYFRVATMPRLLIFRCPISNFIEPSKRSYLDAIANVDGETVPPIFESL